MDENLNIIGKAIDAEEGAADSLPPAKSVLDEAIEVTCGDRFRDYDHAIPNHERIAGAWNWYLAARKCPQDPISAFDAAIMMALLKVARIAYTPTRDALVDLAGYAKCASQIAKYEP